jgi:hypothetical protein
MWKTRLKVRWLYNCRTVVVPTKWSVIALLAAMTTMAGAGLPRPAAATTTCTFTTQGNVMRLNADCTTDASIPVPNGFTLNGAGHTITAVDPPGAPPLNDHFKGGVVVNDGAVFGVVNLHIVGHLMSTTCDSANPFRGIFMTNTSQVKIQNNTLSEIHRGTGNPCAPAATGTAEIVGNEIVNYQRLGIFVNGNVRATIVDNVLRSTVPAPLPDGRFAIAIFFAPTGFVAGNRIVGGFVAGGQNVTGILVSDSRNVLVSNNQVSGTNFGIALQALCTSLGTPPTSGNVVSDNEIQGSNTGILLLPQVIVPTVCNPQVNRNVVQDNEVSDGGGAVGISVVPVSNNSFQAVADANVIKRNEIEGYVTPILDQGTHAVISNNEIEP